MNQPKIKLFLTFDHELPLGGVKTTWEDALFEPTRQLFDIAHELNVPVTLFTDVLCGIRFREWDKTSFYEPYIKQLLEAINRNHDVQLHLHPHWLTSNFEGKKFLPSNDYTLSDFVLPKGSFTVESIITEGVNFLNEHIKPHFPEYRCLAFRAGGYNLGHPDSRELILRELYSHGIRYDSSIAKGYYFSSGISEVDYRNVPKDSTWHLPFNGNFKNKGDSGILEIPIASIPKSLFEVPTLFKMKKYAYRAPLGRGYQIHEGKPGSVRNKVKAFMSTRMLGFDNYTYDFKYLLKILDYNITKYRNEDLIMLSIVGHPKTMGDYAWDMMRFFVKNVRTKYPQAEFTTFSAL